MPQEAFTQRNFFVSIDMNSLENYLAREKLCRQHAELDKTTAGTWSEEAEICAKLVQLEKRLMVLKSNKIRSSKR